MRSKSITRSRKFILRIPLPAIGRPGILILDPASARAFLRRAWYECPLRLRLLGIEGRLTKREASGLLPSE